jgi:protein SCO1
MNSSRWNKLTRRVGRLHPLDRPLLLSFCFGIVLCVSGFTRPAMAIDAPPPPFLSDIGIDQNLDQQIPLNLTFRNEAGQSVQLGELVRSKPTILMFVYYECPMLCTMSLNNLLGAIKVIPFDVGKEFDIITVSFDPSEDADLASAKKDSYVRQYARAGAAGGWHFLTGEAGPIRELTAAAGFRYAWDEPTQQFAHASGFMILTPEGRLARYFFGHNYSPSDLRLSLVEASQGKIGSATDAILLYCFHYDPAKGKYSLAIMNLLRAAGVLTLVLMGGFVARSLLQERRSPRAAAGAPVKAKQDDATMRSET